MIHQIFALASEFRNCEWNLKKNPFFNGFKHEYNNNNLKWFYRILNSTHLISSSQFFVLFNELLPCVCAFVWIIYGCHLFEIHERWNQCFYNFETAKKISKIEYSDREIKMQRMKKSEKRQKDDFTRSKSEENIQSHWIVITKMRKIA